jgi:hypothetical protein
VRDKPAVPEIFFFLPRCAYVVSVKAMQIEYPESWTAAAGSTTERFENEARMRSQRGAR